MDGPSVAEIIAEEFADVASFAQVVRITIRLSVAAVLGGILGYEREAHGKAAGVRTHMLVALGAAVFVLVPQQAGVTDEVLTRVIQGLVAGIGFIGAGAILKKTDEEHVLGLTTAAGIWLTAAVGIAAGMGRESTAILSTVFAVVILTVMPKVVSLFGGTNTAQKDSTHPPKDGTK